MICKDYRKKRESCQDVPSPPQDRSDFPPNFLLNFLSATNSVFPNAVSIGVLILIGFSAVNLLFLVQHLIGIEGHPRRVFLSPEIFVGYANFANIAVPLLILAMQVPSIRRSASAITGTNVVTDPSSVFVTAATFRTSPVVLSHHKSD